MRHFLFFFTFLILSSGNVIGNEIDSLLLLLDETMLTREQYDVAKETEILRLKDLLKEAEISEEQKYHIHRQIILEYEPYNFDSTLAYIEKNQVIALALNNAKLTIESHLNLSGLLASSGRYKEAIDILNNIQRHTISDDLLNKYFNHYADLYSNIAAYTTLQVNRKLYNHLSKLYADSLAACLKSDNEKHLALQEYKYREMGHLMESKKINSRRLAMSQMGSRQYAIATYDRSIIYELEQNIEQQKIFLIRSAISDIRSSVKDNASLSMLALILHREKNIERAYRYINFSMEDAIFYNSRLRFISISNILPVITEAYQLESNKQKEHLKNLIKIISGLLFILLVAVIFIYIQMKNLSHAKNNLRYANNQLKELNNELNSSNTKLNKLNKELSETNHIKEQYIANFLNICSNYIDKLDNYRKTVHRHINNRKIQELFELTKSKQIIEAELNEFYSNFDTTFLSIYPNFVSELNNLLLTDEQIILKKGERLNTELRIFALIRLGISDSSKIAKLLRYSVNTIYNYRVRIKNKAAGNRDNFEQMVMDIDSYSELS